MDIRDEEENNLNSQYPSMNDNDDCISLQSGCSGMTTSTMCSTVSSRTVSKKRLKDIAAKAKEEIQECAPRHAIQQVRKILS